MRPETDPKAARLKRIRTLSHVLDSSIGIPGTRYRFGLDPILGLLPGGGDFASFLFSAYIIWESAQLGVSQEILTKMVSNVLFDTVAGTVPVLGDLLDVTWKANTKNVALLEDHLQAARPHSRTVSRWVVLAALLGLLIAFIGVVTLSFLVFSWLLRQFTGG
ncbi:MAG TPA: DUF4112 domain-containing protein [Allocoleopsis sp.]